MRELSAHKIPESESPLTIRVLDDAGVGGANAAYMILGHGTSEHSTRFGRDPYTVLKFQAGPPAEVGTNGFTVEALLAIVADRLEGFQAGPFACVQNARALTAVNVALEALHDRTRERATRGVLGTHQA